MLEYAHVTALARVAVFRASGGEPAGPLTVPPDHEIVELVVAGQASISIDGRWRLVGPGSLLWHLPGEATSCRLFGGPAYECLVVDFRTDRPVPRQVPRCCRIGDVEAARALQRDLLTAYHQDGYDAFLLCRRIHAELQWRAHAAGRRRIDPFQHPALTAVVEHIERHFADPLSVEDLARMAGIGDKYLHELFARVLDSSPHRYLLERRITASRQLLAGTDMTVKEIARRCGFGDPGHFGRTFKHFLGLTPSAYRQRHLLETE